MKKIILCAACALFLFPAIAQAATPKVTEVTSRSGIKAWLVEDHTLPLISLRFAFRGGVEFDPADKQGLAVLATSLLTQGAGPYDDKAFQDRLSSRSIQMEIGASRDEISGEVKTLTREKKEAFRLLALALTRPRFDQEAFDRAVRQQLTAQKMQKAKADWQGRYALYRAVFGEHPYGYRSLGTPQSVAQITREEAKAFIHDHMAKDRLMVAVVGAITPKEVSDALDSTFGGLPAQGAVDTLAPVVWPKETASILVKREGTQTDIHFALPMLRRDDPDWYAAEIANYILGGGGFISRLMKQVRAQEGLTYGISTGLAPMDKGSMLAGSLSADNDKAGKAWAMVRDVWQGFYDGGVSEAEVQAAKDYLTGALPLSLTSTDALASVLLAMQQEKLGKDYLDTRKASLEAVTLADVQRVIVAWFDPAQLSVSFVGEPEAVSITETHNMILE